MLAHDRIILWHLCSNHQCIDGLERNTLSTLHQSRILTSSQEKQSGEIEAKSNCIHFFHKGHFLLCSGSLQGCVGHTYDCLHWLTWYNRSCFKVIASQWLTCVLGWLEATSEKTTQCLLTLLYNCDFIH